MSNLLPALNQLAEHILSIRSHSVRFVTNRTLFFSRHGTFCTVFLWETCTCNIYLQHVCYYSFTTYSITSQVLYCNLSIITMFIIMLRSVVIVVLFIFISPIKISQEITWNVRWHKGWNA